MRYLKRQTLDRRTANNTTLYTDAGRINVYLEPTGTGSVVVPKGNTATKPSGVTGMIRYNTQTDQFEGYQSGAWRTFRFKESTAITQQNLGAGNGSEVYFGPLNPAPPATVQSGGTWGGQNVLVIVENVLQLHTTNYTVLQNPTLGAETYSGVTSASASSSATTLYFNTALVGISLSTGNLPVSNTVTITFSTRPAVPFSIGSTIVVTGFTPSGYNGTFSVTACTTSSVSYTNSTTATMTFAGQIASTTAVYPSANFTSAIITGSASLQASTAVTAFSIDADTNALVSATFTGQATTGTIAAGVTLTITEAGATGSGYYLKFSSPVPYGKIVTALIGFDQ